MKKVLAMLMALLLVCACTAVSAEGERAVASYEYVLGEEGAYVENLIFPADVVISGENTQIIFSNCEFSGDIILTANEATRVLLLGCEVNGTCIIRNVVREATLEYPMPKFMTDAPVNVSMEECVGSVIALGDFEIVVNGETCAMKDGQLFSDVSNPDAGIVPYEGQEASYYACAHWYENDKLQAVIVCEYDPSI